MREAKGRRRDSNWPPAITEAELVPKRAMYSPEKNKFYRKIGTLLKFRLSGLLTLWEVKHDL